MAPFPETEIMTLKRLEVALRKQDFKLLKDGAYKLHEKFHGGHKFEYIDLIKDILLDIQTNSNVPNEIKSILVPTIEDILSAPCSDADESSLNDESQNRVSSLTSLSYNTKMDDTKKAAFDAFVGPKKSDNENSQLEVQKQTFTQSPFSAEPFKEFSAMKVVNAQSNESACETADSFKNESQQNENDTNFAVNENNDVQISEPTKVVSIFYGQKVDSLKLKNISKYRKLIKDESSSLVETMTLLMQIKAQIEANSNELIAFLNQLKTKQEKFNIITNLQSSSIVDLMVQNNIDYTLFDNYENKKANIIPLFGLDNLYKCSRCGYETLDIQKQNKPFVLECPNCKNPMFPNFYYAIDNDCEINLDYYNSAFNSLVDSNVWLLIHPVCDEKIVLNLLTNSLKHSNKLEKIFILDSDIKTKDTFKNIFMNIRPDIKISVTNSDGENFLNS